MSLRTPSYTRTDTLFPYTTLFRPTRSGVRRHAHREPAAGEGADEPADDQRDRRSDRDQDFAAVRIINIGGNFAAGILRQPDQPESDDDADDGGDRRSQKCLGHYSRALANPLMQIGRASCRERVSPQV